ncbi:MAG: helix-turn-helix transcriptional regulator [bacterium]|nr:helix-turn-helix transcriptional regulator [bacterium]
MARAITELLGRLRTAIKTRGLTQARVARDLGLSPSTLSAFLRGKTSGPLDRVLLICDVIGLPSEELFLHRASTAEQQLQILLDTRGHPNHLLGRLDQAAVISAARGLLAAAQKRQQVMGAAERNHLNKVVRWCEATIAVDKRAQRRPAGAVGHGGNSCPRNCPPAEGRSCRV